MGVVNGNSIQNVIRDEPDGGPGPAMSQLNQLQQAFVRAVVERPFANNAALAKAAGYNGSNITLRAHAHRLKHNARILDAIHEETEKRVRFGGLIGIAGLLTMATDPNSPFHFKACNSLADRGGFAAVARQEIKVEHTDHTGQALVDRIRQLAEQLGLDTSRMLGESSADMKLIEGKMSHETKSGSD